MTLLKVLDECYPSGRRSASTVDLQTDRQSEWESTGWESSASMFYLARLYLSIPFCKANRRCFLVNTRRECPCKSSTQSVESWRKAWDRLGLCFWKYSNIEPNILTTTVQQNPTASRLTSNVAHKSSKAHYIKLSLMIIRLEIYVKFMHWREIIRLRTQSNICLLFSPHLLRVRGIGRAHEHTAD